MTAPAGPATLAELRLITRLLSIFAIVLALLGTAASAALAGSTDLGVLWAEVSRQFSIAFTPWTWRLGLTVGVGALGLAVVLKIADALASIRFRPRAPKLSEMPEDATLLETVQLVGARLNRCATATRGRPHVISLVDEILRGALVLRASDVHISPTSAAVRVTYRVQGTLHEVTTLSPETSLLITNRVKILCGMGTHIRHQPQDGRLSTSVGGVAIEARVSTLPTESGERIVIRILRGGLPVPDLDGLGLSPRVLTGIRDLLERPQGVLLLSGPVGSGKTTSLYAFLRHISTTRGSTATLVTLEDPVELELPFAAQTQIHVKGGVTFATGLRSILRQDPNVLMVGEIRDHETAEIAMQAGLTGHLLLTTVHSDSASGAMARLLEMNVETFALASAVAGSLSQRLVRALCRCRRRAPATDAVSAYFESQGMPLPPGDVFYEAVGCERCGGEGYEGRRIIAELMVVNPEVRRVIQRKNPTAEIARVAIESGTVPLLQDGLDRALAGETSLEEVLRVTR